jgi:proteic killer suppression protein
MIRSVRHRGLLRLIRDDDSRELRSDLVQRLRRILTALITASDVKALQGPPGWRVHQLHGDRARDVERFGQRQLAADLRPPAW